MRGNLPPAPLFGFFWVRRSASRKPPRLGFIKRTVLFFCRGKISDTMRIVTANIRLAARFPGASKKLVTVGQLITDRERLRAGLLPPSGTALALGCLFRNSDFGNWNCDHHARGTTLADRIPQGRSSFCLGAKEWRPRRYLLPTNGGLLSRLTSNTRCCERANKNKTEYDFYNIKAVKKTDARPAQGNFA
jgi:hypothetical protein